MSMHAEECSAQDNRDWLLGHFATLLHAQEPRSVLDVGCGNGLLMKACLERGVATTGIDLPGPGLDALGADGLDVREGTAAALPFEDGSVDWVTLRHVPHHLEQPATELDRRGQEQSPQPLAIKTLADQLHCRDQHIHHACTNIVDQNRPFIGRHLASEYCHLELWSHIGQHPSHDLAMGDPIAYHQQGTGETE